MNDPNKFAENILGKAVVQAMGGVSHITIEKATEVEQCAFDGSLRLGDKTTFHFNSSAPLRQFVVTWDGKSK